jgi:23S rRNA (adenine2503-C2)-methyltransferase
MKNTIYDFTYEQLNTWLMDKGEKSYRTKQIFQWLYRRRITDFAMMSDIKQSLIETFNEDFMIDPIKIKQRQASKDGTVKYLFELQDGFLVETVLMQFDYGKSVCVSSQVGCNMGCTFCASGLLKKNRDLSAGEMMAQVMVVQRELDVREERVSHIVIMGTGEPFDNYDNVMDFLKTVNHDLGLAIGARHLSVSTCGIVPRIKQFAREKVQYNLAISLHAPNDTLRSKLMPINQAYPLSELIDALKEYSTLNNRRITLEYILLKDVNDQAEHATQLSKLVKGMNAYVNLIPYNVVDEHGFRAVDVASALKFYDKLMKLGVKSTLRKENGGDIDAACGQLRAKAEGKL